MLEPIVLLILSLGVILLGAELFTNGIEWFGRRRSSQWLRRAVISTEMAIRKRVSPFTLLLGSA